MNEKRKPKYDYDDPIPKRIRGLLDNNRESQQDLSKAIGISPKAVSYLVLGINGPSLETLIDLAHHFHVTTDYLLGLSDVKTASAEVRAISEYTGLSPDSIEALHYMHTVPKEVLAKPKDSENTAPLRFINLALEEWKDVVGYEGR